MNLPGPDTVTVKMLNAFMPAIRLMAIVAIPAIIIPLAFRIINVMKEQFLISSDSSVINFEPKPKNSEEMVTYSESDYGYWVNLPDGSRTLVEMKELYPNDAEFQKKPIDLEKYGTFIYDKVQKRMVRK